MLTMPMFFADHMVLQRNKKLRIFGRTAPDTLVKVRLTSDRVVVERSKYSEEDGNFCVNLPPQPAGYGRELTVTDGTDTFVFTDVAVGEVWLAGGQSNMEYLMDTDAEKEEEQKKIAGNVALAERLRFFDYPEVAYEGAMEDRPEDYVSFGLWRKLTEADLPYFSAVSYYFMQKITPYLEDDVPVAVVGCNWGGSSASCWMPEETVKAAGGEVWLTDFEDELEAHKEELDAAMAQFKSMRQGLADPAVPDPFKPIVYPGFSKEEQEAAMQQMDENMPPQFRHPLHYWRPCGLYYTMLQKLMPYTLRGFIWYQGCSDEVHADLYQKMLSALIHLWREDFMDDTLPFLMVQLAPFEWWLGNPGTNYPTLRAQQLLCADLEENVYAASIGDAGMQYDIHPKFKRKPGERLGLLALKYVYGQDVEADAPRAVCAKAESDHVVISFENAKGLHLGPVCNGGFAEPLEKAPVKNFVKTFCTVPEGDLEAEILDDQVVLKLTVDGQPVIPEKVSFAWEPYYEINLYNEAGLPVFPFQLTVKE